MRRGRGRSGAAAGGSSPGQDAPEPVRLSDERVLEIVGRKLAEMAGEWVLEPGPALKGPGTFAVRVAASHEGDFRHVDLEFLLNADQADQTSLAGCTSGFADDPEEAIWQAVDAWAATTASVAFELVEQQGRFAGHFAPGEPGGWSGWHTIIGGIGGWGVDPASASAKAQWFAGTSPWSELAPMIASGLDRDSLNGIRLLAGQGGRFQSCEVKINGRLHGPSTAALAAMNWPRSKQMSTAKVFLLLVHPAGAPAEELAARLGVHQQDG
jgi:hypothetical protein